MVSDTKVEFDQLKVNILWVHITWNYFFMAFLSRTYCTDLPFMVDSTNLSVNPTVRLFSFMFFRNAEVVVLFSSRFNTTLEIKF